MSANDTVVSELPSTRGRMHCPQALCSESRTTRSDLTPVPISLPMHSSSKVEAVAPIPTPDTKMAVIPNQKPSSHHILNPGNDKITFSSTDSASGPVTAQGSIAQLQEKWSETMMISSPQLRSKSKRLGQWVKDHVRTTPKIEEDESTTADKGVATPSSSTPSSTTPSKETPPLTKKANPLPIQTPAMKRQKARIQLRYGAAVESIQDTIHQVVISDELFRKIKYNLREEKAVTNSLLKQTLHKRLLQVHLDRIAEQQELAQQLRAMNQANEQAFKHMKQRGGNQLLKKSMSLNMLQTHSSLNPKHVQQ